MPLSPRLMAVARLIPKCESLVDIGTDHGYLPIYLLKTERIDYATAADVRMGPLAKAKENIDTTGVNAHLVLSDGFDNITRHHDVATVCGMGGETMADIIQRGGDKTPKTLVVQPMTGCDKIRKYFFENGYVITDESFAVEGDKVYCVIKAEYTGKNTPYTYSDLFLGKIRPETEEFSAWKSKTSLGAEKRLRGSKTPEYELALIEECR